MPTIVLEKRAELREKPEINAEVFVIVEQGQTVEWIAREGRWVQVGQPVRWVYQEGNWFQVRATVDGRAYVGYMIAEELGFRAGVPLPERALGDIEYGPGEFVAQFLEFVFGNTSPSLPSGSSNVYTGQYVFFPQFAGQGTDMVDFWSTVFVSVGERIKEFEQQLETHIQQSGHSFAVREISFAQSVFRGKIRPFRVVALEDVEGLIFLSPIGQGFADVYVSIRLLYKGRVSAWKRNALLVLLIFAAFMPSLIFYVPLGVWMGVFRYSTDLSSGILNLPFALALIFFSAFFFGAVQLWSVWRFGDRFALIRVDFDELHRDDLSALGYELYQAVMLTGDVLNLEQLIPKDQQVKPTFGVGAQTNGTRKRRI